MGVIAGERAGVRESPAGGCGAGLVLMLSRGCSFCRYFRHGGARDFRHGGARGGLVDDGFAVGVGGEEGLDGEVVDGAGVATAGLVDQGGGVVGEQGVGSAREGEVVAQVAGGGTVALCHPTAARSIPDAPLVIVAASEVLHECMTGGEDPR